MLRSRKEVPWVFDVTPFYLLLLQLHFPSTSVQPILWAVNPVSSGPDIKRSATFLGFSQPRSLIQHSTSNQGMAASFQILSSSLQSHRPTDGNNRPTRTEK